MKYFTIEELCKSETAERLDIDNAPSEEIISNLTYFVDRILDPLREAWGSAILVNSGFRCELLNKAIGGSKTSAHKTGWAVDLYPKNGKMEDFKKFVIDFFNGKMWDQIVLETDGNKVWIHIGLFNNSGKQRRQIFSIDK